jgi:hypothetical protein
MRSWGRRSVALLVVAAWGCSKPPPPKLFLRLHDPRATAIDVQTPRGTERALPPGPGPREVALARESPPYDPTTTKTLILSRTEDGATAVLCPECPRTTPYVLVPEDGRYPKSEGLFAPAAPQLSLDSTPWEYVGDSLVLHVRLGYAEGGKQHDVARVDVVTPKTNIESFRLWRPVHRPDIGTVLFLGLGGAMVVGGAWFTGAGFRVHQAGPAAVCFLVGIPLLVGGTAWSWFLLDDAFQSGVDRDLSPAGAR